MLICDMYVDYYMSATTSTSCCRPAAHHTRYATHRSLPLRAPDLFCQITCSILEDPVMLPCNHPLCRGCATQCLRQNQRCPQCLTPIPNLRMLQGRNTWIAEMVCSLKNCLNDVGVSLTQHAPGLCLCRP